MSKTLLEKAEEYQPSRRSRYTEVSDEQLDLALAWFRDEIRTCQATSALGYKTSNYVAPTVQRLAMILRHASLQGMVTLKKK